MCRRLRSPVAFLAVVALLGVGCSDDDDTEAASTTAPADTDTPATTAAPTEPTTATPATAAPDAGADVMTAPTGIPLCDAYLAWLSAQDGAQFNTALGQIAEIAGDDAPQTVTEAIDTIGAADADVISVLEAQATLGDFVDPTCREAFDAGVVGLPEGGDVAAAFFEALRTGDRDFAATLAPADVIARFEPWEPLPEDPDLGTPTLVSTGLGDFAMLLASTVSVYCTTDGRVVFSCAFGE